MWLGVRLGVAGCVVGCVAGWRGWGVKGVHLRPWKASAAMEGIRGHGWCPRPQMPSAAVQKSSFPG